MRTTLLARTAAGAGSRSLAVAATWHLEKHAWFAAGTALAGVVVHGVVPPLDDAALRDGEHGWAEAIALPDDRWQAADGPALAQHLEAHLAPLVTALTPYRPRRALWRSIGDRLGQAALWCAEALDDDAAIAVATEALTAPTRLRAPAAFTTRAGRRFRPRTGCCLSHRCDGGVECDDCPLVCRGR